MQITIISSGSRGDVQPYVALGRGLQAAGHQVTLATHGPFEKFVTDYGLQFAPLAGDPRQILDGDAGKRLIEMGDKPAQFFKLYAKLNTPLTPLIVRDALDACRSADVILCPTNSFFIGEMIAEKLHKPLISLSVVPFAPTAEQPGIGMPKLSKWSAWLLVPFRHYHTMQVIGMQYFAACFIEQMNDARQNILGLPPRSRWLSPKLFRDGSLFLYGYSPHVYRRPTDWSDRQQLTGFWFLESPAGWQPPPKLVEFLAAGPPPVSIGFGSMTPQSPEELARIVVDALRRSKQRGILLSGWAGMTADELGDDVFVIDAVPHDWLFPQVSAVVHHGGAGTTAAGLRAGKPTVIVPFLGDQPFWGRRVQELGVGPAPINKRALSADSLAQAIGEAVNTPDIRRRADELGANLRAENGVQTAVNLIQRELDAIAKRQP